MYDISIIIPTHNRSKLLSKTLRLLNGQTYPRSSFEVIVVDDASADDTVKVIQEFQAKAQYKLKYISQPKKGPASARNRGIRESESDFVLFTGDDIFPEENLIERHLASLKGHPQAAVLGFVDWSKEGQVTDFMRYVAPNGFQFRYNAIKDPQDCGFQYFYTSNISLAKKWLTLELFDEDFPYGALEDTELSYRLKKKGLKIIFDKEAIGHHFHPMAVESFCHRMRLTGISAAIMLEKHPELKKMLLPLNPTIAGIIFLILLKIELIKKINKRFYWFCRIVNSYLEGIKEWPKRKVSQKNDTIKA